MKESYEPYLSEQVAFVREHCPHARLYFHQTWAYELDFNGDTFAPYNNDQKLMYDKIVEALEVPRLLGLDVIPCGSVIQLIRSTLPEFDYANGGRSLCRDGYHLSLDYGRYVAAATWFVTLTGKPVTAHTSLPLDKETVDKLNTLINGFILG
jgi:hypothetical protein